MLKRNKYIFLIFWARQGLTLVLRILIKNEKSGLRSSLGETIWKTFEKNIWFFWRWTWQGLALLLRILRWRIKDHVVLKKICLFENVDIFIFWNLCFFWYFWITWKYVSHDASGWTDTKKERKTIFGIFENECRAVRTTRLTQKEKEIIFSIFKLFERKCHTTQAVEQTLKWNKIIFCIFEFSRFCKFLWFSNLFLIFYWNIKNVGKKKG